MNPLMNMLQGVMGGNGVPAPLQALITMLKSGGNPQAALAQLVQTNPQLKEAVNMLNAQNPANLEKIARQLYSNKGLDINQAIQQLQQLLRG